MEGEIERKLDLGQRSCLKGRKGEVEEERESDGFKKSEREERPTWSES